MLSLTWFVDVHQSYLRTHTVKIRQFPCQLWLDKSRMTRTIPNAVASMAASGRTLWKFDHEKSQIDCSVTIKRWLFYHEICPNRFRQLFKLKIDDKAKYWFGEKRTHKFTGSHCHSDGVVAVASEWPDCFGRGTIATGECRFMNIWILMRFSEAEPAAHAL